MSIHRLWHTTSKYSLGLEARFYDIKGDDEFIVYDYYGNPLSINGISLVIFPMFGSIRYFPFEGKIANNFSPYFTGKAGALLTQNGDERIGSFFERWKKSQSYITFGGQLGIGIDFILSNVSSLSVGVGIDILPMAGTVDGKTQYNGLLLQFEFNWHK